MSKFLAFMLHAALALALTAALAANALGDAAKRPTVGLVLGGGGARGAAHIGVLEVLEKLRVPVDCVAGTSMGALVGGAYAAGTSPAEMRTVVAKVDWRDLFRDTPDYSEQNFRYKHLSQLFVPGTEIGTSKQGLRTPPSFIEGQNIKMFLNRLVHANLGEREIEKLPLPLSIIAADIGSGDRVVFRTGSLTAAMRASMAVPALLAPYEYQGRKMVDGSLVDNLPIGEVRDRCHPDVVIVVNVGAPLLKADQVGSLVTVLTQAINLLTEQNVTLSLATLKPQDIYIKPDLDGIGTTDFTKYADAVERGRKAAESLADKLRGLAVSEKDYQAWWRNIQFAERSPPRVDAVEVAGLKYVNPQAVERYIEQRPGESLDTEQLDRDVMRIYGDGFYESVDYSLLSVRDRNILRVTPVEKPWGKDYLRFGLALDANSKDATYNLRGAYHKTWVNNLGGELVLIGQLGSEPAVLGQFYQPLDVHQHFFVQPEAGYFRRDIPVYQDNRRLAEYRVTENRFNLLSGANIGINGQARLGWVGRERTSTLDTGQAVLPDSTNRWGAWTASIDFDRFNRLFLPSNGWSTRFEYSQPIGRDYTKVVGDMHLVRPVGNYIVHGRFYFVDSPRGTLPIYDAESLGGMQNLSGFATNQIIGDGIRLGLLRVEKIIGQLPLGVRGDVRVGVGLEAGRVNHRYTETGLNGWLSTAGIYLGSDTPVGPAYLGYARSPQGSSILYFFVGTP